MTYSKPSLKTIILAWSFVIITLVGVTVPTYRDEPSLDQPTYRFPHDRDLATSSSAPLFIDKTLEANLLIPHSQRSENISGIHETLGSGICSLDLNQDGWLDLLILVGSQKTHYYGKPQWWQEQQNSAILYLNNQDGTFSNITQTSGLNTNAVTIGCTIGDLDNDGDQDIFLSNRGKNELWENIGNNQFQQRKLEHNSSTNWSVSSSMADFNQDGLLDIYIANYIAFKPNSLTFEASAGYKEEQNSNFNSRLHSGQRNTLLINQGELLFSDETDNWQVGNSQGRGLAITAYDINKDSLPDLLVSNDHDSENKVYLNKKNRFEDISTKTGLGILDSTTNMRFANLHNSENDTLIITNATGDYTKAFSENQNKAFTDISESLNLHRQTYTHSHNWPSAIADFNHDGKTDILIPNGLNKTNQYSQQLSQNQPANLLLNKQNNTFERSGINQEAIPLGAARCAIAGDFNLDGSVDAIIARNNDLPELLINQSKPNKWIGFILKTNQSSSLTGSTIYVKTNQRTLTHKIYDGAQGFCWQDNRQITIPLADTEKVIHVSIFSHDKNQTKFTKLTSNHYHQLDLEEGTSITIKKASKKNRNSQIKVKSIDARLATIDWLIQQQKYDIAFSEIQLLLNNNAELRKKATTNIHSLPYQYRLRLIPKLLRDSEKDIMLYGVKLVRDMEDDRLARWFFPLISNQDNGIVCAATDNLSYFYREEEAMILTKYAAMDSLIQATNSSDNKIVRCAIAALGETEQYPALQPLLLQIDNGSPDTRLDSIKALGLVKQKEAIPFLIKAFSNPTETITNRLEALKAIHKIDPQWDIEQFLFDQLKANDNQKDQLEILSVLTEAVTRQDEVQLIPQSSIFNTVKRWQKQNPINLDDATKLQLFALHGINKETDFDWVKSQMTNPSHALTAYLALIQSSEPTKKLNYLVQALQTSSIDTTILSYIESNYLNNPIFIKKITRIPDQKLRNHILNTITPQFNNTAENLLVQYLLTELINSDDSINQQINNIESLLQNTRHPLNQQTCNTLIETLSALDEFTVGMQSYLNKLDNRSLSICYTKSLIAEAPHSIKQLLDKTAAHRQFALKIISKRKERWARELIEQSLSGSMAINSKIELIESLPNKLTASQQRLLQDIFTKNENHRLSIAAANKLSIQPNWLANHSEQLIYRMQTALKNNDDVIAVGYANILLKNEPQLILSSFVNMEK